ncbi:hypothetical protein ACW9FF_17070 [Ralstonia mannitolilytica]
MQVVPSHVVLVVVELFVVAGTPLAGASVVVDVLVLPVVCVG